MGIKKYKLKRIIQGSANNMTSYWGKFSHTLKNGQKEEVTLTMTGEVITGGAPLKDGRKVLKIPFKTPYYEHEFVVDTDNMQQQLFLEKMRLDPKVHSIGKFKPGHLWQLVDENYEAVQEALEIKKRANITHRIYAMGMKELSKLCYFLNVGVNGLSKELIYGKLLHPTKGKIFSIPMRDESNWVDIILNGDFGNDYDVKSSVNKAIILVIIIQKNGAYFMNNGGAVLGTTIDSVYAYFRENINVYTSGLLPELESKDVLPESIDYEGELESVMGVIKSAESTAPILGENGKMTDEKRAELRKRAKEIGVKGIIQNFSDAVLVQKVTEKEAAFVENQNV